MANKNNNTDSLVSEIDDPTAEFEQLSDTSAAEDAEASIRESDDPTFSFEGTDDVDEIPVSRLRSHLRTRNESIDKLQFDIEQLRARWTGLEKEIKAREEITDRLNDEIRELKRELADERKRVSEKSTVIERLRRELSGKDDELERSAAELGAVHDDAETRAARISVLEMQQSSDARSIATLEGELRKVRDELASRTEQSSERSRSLEAKLEESQLAVADLTQYVAVRKASWSEQEAELARKDRLLGEQARQIESLSAEVSTALASASTVDRDDEAAFDDRSIAVADAHHQAEIRELEAQIRRTEAYADSLRQQLQDARREAKERDQDQAQLRQALDDALDQIHDLRAQLEDERLTKAEVEAQKAAMQRKYDGEIGRLKDDLETAQSAIDNQNAINEQLAADLVDSGAASRALEERIRELQEQFNLEQAEMQSLIDRQQRQLDEYTYKLDSKNNSIAALLNELATKSSALHSLDEIGHVVSDLDDRMTAIDESAGADAPEGTGPAERERSTRLLVGTIDGQELRFPLFKDRLTIGRADNNDIQLKTQCISRQHAIIVSDAGGCRITDRDSKNGVYVNDRRVSECGLVSGDRVVIGTATLVFEERSKR